MSNKETLTEFYAQHGETVPQGQFNVFRIEDFGCARTYLPPNRRDFYKVSFVTQTEGILSYSDKSIHIKGPCLTFTNPMIPYSWQPLNDTPLGYFCVFTEDFIDGSLKNGGLSQSPLFKLGNNHLFIPQDDKLPFITGIYENMIAEMQSSYSNKFDLIKSYLQILMHEALKMQQPDSYYQAGNASQRISNLFIELLERQFPIDSPNQVISLKNANEYATQLSVHTNHLNRALKETTGKTTSEWIAEHLIKEAKALLLHSSWDIAQIGYCLGFEHSSNFNIFFKKETGHTPNQFRKEVASIS